jgi:hypothetical protein
MAGWNDGFALSHSYQPGRDHPHSGATVSRTWPNNAERDIAASAAHTRPPSPRHARCIAREKECDSARGQRARRGFPPGEWHARRERVTSARPTRVHECAAHVGPPKTRLGWHHLAPSWPALFRALVHRRLGANRCESLVAAGAG